MVFVLGALDWSADAPAGPTDWSAEPAGGAASWGAEATATGWE